MDNVTGGWLPYNVRWLVVLNSVLCDLVFEYKDTFLLVLRCRQRGFEYGKMNTHTLIHNRVYLEAFRDYSPFVE